MLSYPEINPVALQLGPLAIHWYGLMYLLGFLLAYGLAKLRSATIPQMEVGDFIFFAALGVIVGGRIGYMLIYDTVHFFKAPWELFMIWRGGMSFHGGLIGVLLSLLYFAKKNNISYLKLMDFTAPLVPLGLAAGRVGNFINGELWGRATDKPWGMVFPHVDLQPRHPSQLYECFLEGIVLFIILWWVSRKPRTPGIISALFLLLYATFRFILEFFRVPDPQRGFYWQYLTMGQLLSVGMLLLGVIVLVYSFVRKT